MIRALAIATALAAVVPGTPYPPTISLPHGHVVVAFVPGFQPGRVVPNAAEAALVVQTARHRQCAADVWLTLGWGARAAMPGTACTTPTVTNGNIDGWAEIVRANTHYHFGAKPGALAASLARRGECVGATGPLAALAAADATGHLAEYHAAPAVGRCRVQLVDATSAPSFDDATMQATNQLEADQAIFVGLPNGAHFGAVAVTKEVGLLRGSTGRDGIVILPDVTAYVSDPASLTTVHRAQRPLADVDRREHLKLQYSDRYKIFGVGLPLLLLYLWWAARRRVPRPVALTVASIPAAGFLVSAVPWWRASRPGLAVSAGVAVAAVAIAASGARLARLDRAPAAVGVAGVCAALLTVDAVTGAHLERDGLASYSAILGGRFYGIGNAGFAVLATAAVIAVGALARRIGAPAWLLLVPLIGVDALGPLGADFGGAIALTAALVVGVATRARRTAVVLGSLAGVAIAIGAALVDYARPHARQTHLGRFVGDVLHGNWSDTLVRKASEAIHSVTGTPLPVVVVLSLAVAVYALRRLADSALHPTVRALVVLWVVGSVVNDSGILVAAAGVAMATPLLLAYADS